jgi:hypothetical protein
MPLQTILGPFMGIFFSLILSSFGMVVCHQSDLAWNLRVVNMIRWP